MDKHDCGGKSSDIIANLEKARQEIEILVIESVYMVVQFILIAMRGSLQNVTLGTENPTGFITTAQARSAPGALGSHPILFDDLVIYN